MCSVLLTVCCPSIRRVAEDNAKLLENLDNVTGAAFTSYLSAFLRKQLVAVSPEVLIPPVAAEPLQPAPPTATAADSELAATYSEACDVTLCQRDVEVCGVVCHVISLFGGCGLVG